MVHMDMAEIIKVVHKWLKFRKLWIRLSLGSVPGLNSFEYVFQ